MPVHNFKNAEVYLEPYQTCKMDLFAKMLKGTLMQIWKSPFMFAFM